MTDDKVLSSLTIRPPPSRPPWAFLSISLARPLSQYLPADLPPHPLLRVFERPLQSLTALQLCCALGLHDIFKHILRKQVGLCSRDLA